MYKCRKSLFIVFCCLTSVLHTNPLGAADITQAQLKPKGEHGFKKAKGIWTLTLSNFSTVSSDFTYEIIVSSPTGKQYKTPILSSSNQPVEPVVIELKDPVKGPYFVYVKVLSATVNGILNILAQVSNNKNSTSYQTTYTLNPAIDPVNENVFLSAFSVPH